MDQLFRQSFDIAAFLANAGLGRKIVQLAPKQTFFSQGDPADAVFYLQTGRVKVTVVSTIGKEATIRLVAPDSFFGERAMASRAVPRVTTATAITACTALRITNSEFYRVMHEERQVSDMFSSFLLEISMRTQADLVDQLFNSSEKRLARILLLMADCGQPGEPETLIPKISQETLAEMVGTTRSRISFFMNRFRKLKYIDYKDRIHVHKSLLNVVLEDQLPDIHAKMLPMPALLADRTMQASRSLPDSVPY
jgi:CRP-like cAMP-binding protein